MMLNMSFPDTNHFLVLEQDAATQKSLLTNSTRLATARGKKSIYTQNIKTKASISISVLGFKF